MNADEIERLREIAGKATQGEWPAATWYGSMDGGFAAIGPHHLTPDGESDEPGGVAETRALADARHIAAFNPPTALALLDRLDALEAEVVALRRLVALATAPVNKLAAIADIQNDGKRGMVTLSWEVLSDIFEARNRFLDERAALAALEARKDQTP